MKKILSIFITMTLAVGLVIVISPRDALAAPHTYSFTELSALNGSGDLIGKIFYPGDLFYSDSAATGSGTIDDYSSIIIGFHYPSNTYIAAQATGAAPMAFAELAALASLGVASWYVSATFVSIELISIDVKPAAYTITYIDPNGATNPNPPSYEVSRDSESALLAPMALLPLSLPGWEFLGWYDSAGQLVTSIPVGTSGGVTLEARWSEVDGSERPGGPTGPTVPPTDDIGGMIGLLSFIGLSLGGMCVLLYAYRHKRRAA